MLFVMNACIIYYPTAYDKGKFTMYLLGLRRLSCVSYSQSCCAAVNSLIDSRLVLLVPS